jgi:hypothetical protein
VVAAGIAVASVPPARARVKALPVLAEATDIGMPRPLAPDIERSEVTLDGVAGHLYAGGTDCTNASGKPGIKVLCGDCKEELEADAPEDEAGG